MPRSKNINSKNNDPIIIDDNVPEKLSIEKEELSDREYYNYIKEPIDKIIQAIDLQINHLNIEDVIRCLKIINNLKSNIHESILLLIEYDKILTDRFDVLEKKKDTLIELNQLFFEHNKLNILKKITENKENKEKKENKVKVNKENKVKVNKKIKEINKINEINEINETNKSNKKKYDKNKIDIILSYYQQNNKYMSKSSILLGLKQTLNIKLSSATLNKIINNTY